MLAAVTLADSVGIPAAAMQQAIAAFTGVEHRLEMVAMIAGVTYVNDSIATSPERALAALAAFDEPLVLLAGGRDKDMVWDEWARQVVARVAQVVVLFGELGPQLEAQLTGTNGCSESLRCIAARDDAGRGGSASGAAGDGGDVVLLSPGGTSYDAFPDFAARGAHFRDLVAALQTVERARSREDE